MDPTLSFQLDKKIVNDLKKKYPNPFEGQPSISVFTFMRTYSRNIYDSVGNYTHNESFFDVCLRCVNGTMSLAKDKLGRSWKDEDWVPMAIRLFELMITFKLLPSGRNLWALGTELVHTKKLGLALFNCTFHSSEHIDKVKAEFFCYNMDALMLGSGVGFDDLGAGKLSIVCPEAAPYQIAHPTIHITNHLKEMMRTTKKLSPSGKPYLKHEIDYIRDITSIHRNHYNVHVVEDTREGWVDAVRTMINSYIDKTYITIFDYSKIRPAGIPLKTFGGTSSGPQPLAEGMAIIRCLLQSYIGCKMDELLICDICNIIAMIVVAGNVRRSSQIFLFNKSEMCKIKDWNDPQYNYRTMAEGWAYNSNNSFCVTDTLTNEEYAKHLDEFIPRMNMNGEPGIFNRDVCRRYGRIEDGPTNTDMKIKGPNPCGEMPQEGDSPISSAKPGSAGGESCNLVEIIMPNVATLDEFLEVCRFALFLSKMVATVPLHWKGADEIQHRNYRLGISQTGIVDFLSAHDFNLEMYKTWLDAGYKEIRRYDEEISGIFNIPKSIKVTTIKPSGTLSLIANVSSGMHAIRSEYFIRRVRFTKTKTDLIKVLSANGIHIEPLSTDVNNTVVSSFPVKYDKGYRTKANFSFKEQAELLLLLQRYWADNSVSCTLEFREHEMPEVKQFLLNHREEIKGAAFLAVRDYIYPQLPQETITKERYDEMMVGVTPLTDTMFLTSVEQEEEETDNYCSGESCMLRR